MAKSSSPINSPFASYDGADVLRLIWRSWGQEKTGKNHFGFTAPGPIYGQYFDPGGIEGVAQKFIRGEVADQPAKAIHSKFYRHRKDMEQEECKALRDEFVADYHYALNHKPGLVQWDETELWALCRFAEFGRESARGREYGPLNGFYRGLLQDAYDAGVNLQLIQKVKESWKDDKPTGKFEPTGFKEANYVVQLNLEHSWSKDDGFAIKVVNCRQNMELAGETFTGFTFADMGQAIFPDSQPDDWA